jgi:tetrapyrrole methylase family protein/MazG family protein
MPKGVTIVGLGPGDPGLLTVEAWRVLEEATEIYLRTERHPTTSALPASAEIRSFDDVYERCDTFDQVYEEIASRVVDLGQTAEGVVYAVPGHPLAGEASVQRILALAQSRGLPVRIVEGLSFIESVCTSLGLDPLSGLQIADAMELATRNYPEFNPDLPLIVGQLYSRDVAADVKLVLMAIYPDEHPVTLVGHAGSAAVRTRQVPLHQLDHDEAIDHLTSLYVPPLAQAGSLSAFQEVVARLRAPGGCPWDREQTHATLRPYLLEETYEVLDALDRGDSAGLEEELGDLLLQVLLHAQIAIEEGEFKMTGVVASIVSKLKRRHPHVFSDLHVSGSEEVLVNWERIKSQEANHVNSGRGLLDGVPPELPALARAQSLKRRAARMGFDWPAVSGAWSKVEEEWQELRQASSAEEQTRELGDLLFALVALAQWLGVDAECALRQATARFARRFQGMERECANRGMPLAALAQGEWEELWRSAKEDAADQNGDQPR